MFFVVNHCYSPSPSSISSAAGLSETQTTFVSSPALMFITFTPIVSRPILEISLALIRITMPLSAMSIRSFSGLISFKLTSLPVFAVNTPAALIHISESMKDVMTNIAETANQVSVGSDDLAKAAQGLAEGSESQAAV